MPCCNVNASLSLCLVDHHGLVVAVRRVWLRSGIPTPQHFHRISARTANCMFDKQVSTETAD